MSTSSRSPRHVVAGILLLLASGTPVENARAGHGASVDDPTSPQSDPYGGASSTTTTTTSSTTSTTAIPSQCHLTSLGGCEVRAKRHPGAKEPRDRFSARCVVAAEPPLAEPTEEVRLALTDGNAPGCSAALVEYSGALERTGRCWRLPREARQLAGFRNLKLCAVSGDPGVYRLSARGRRLDLGGSSGSPPYTVDVSIGDDCESPCSSTTLPPTACLNAAGGPSLLRLRVDAGSELDLGWQGLAHNQELPRGSEMRVCLSDCDLDTDPVCTGVGSIARDGSPGVNGRTFGPPMPLEMGGVPVCVSSAYRDDIRLSHLDITTGEVALDVPLTMTVHQTSVTEPPCPVCQGASAVGAAGQCAGGPNHGRPCVVEGLSRFGNVSSDCPPPAVNRVGELPVDLHLGSGTAVLPGDGAACAPIPLGSGGRCPCPDQRSPSACGQDCSPASCPSDIASGTDQQCCVREGGFTAPCFGGDVVRAGAPSPFFADPIAGSGSWPDLTYPKSAGVVLASTFCTGATASNIVNSVAGLSGPGALLLSSTLTVERLCRDGDRAGLGCSIDGDCPGGLCR